MMYLDDHDIEHCMPPGKSLGRGRYGETGAGYSCGCQPYIHRFKCRECGSLMGWCMGIDDDKGVCPYCRENEETPTDG